MLHCNLTVLSIIHLYLGIMLLEGPMMIQTVNVELQVLDAQHRDGNHDNPEEKDWFAVLPRKTHAPQFISSVTQKQ